MFSFQDIGENALGLWGGALGFLRRFFEKGRPSFLEPSGAEMLRDSEQLEDWWLYLVSFVGCRLLLV
jgi:hypothetical protein